jgi:hypothetical protein
MDPFHGFHVGRVRFEVVDDVYSADDQNTVVLLHLTGDLR